MSVAVHAYEFHRLARVYAIVCDMRATFFFFIFTASSALSSEIDIYIRGMYVYESGNRF